ncbi:MAG: toll/interleukin-1 receptor domain-containing protein [Saprospiraceae bacterium]
MPNEKIFVSYSRVNSEFVTNLANNLRQSGANIWFDQFDIKPGSRWDASIEAALKSSSTLLLILSKSSVASHNVMDEVSYALEEGLRIVPIMLEECVLPFRIRRLQYTDFSKNQHSKKGLNTLVRSLQLDADIAAKFMALSFPENKVPPQKELVEKNKAPIVTLQKGEPEKKITPKQINIPSPEKEVTPIAQKQVSPPTIKKTPIPQRKSEPENSDNKKYILGGVSFLALILAIWGISSMFSKSNATSNNVKPSPIEVTKPTITETQLYKSVKKTGIPIKDLKLNLNNNNVTISGLVKSKTDEKNIIQTLQRFGEINQVYNRLTVNVPTSKPEIKPVEQTKTAITKRKYTRSEWKKLYFKEDRNSTWYVTVASLGSMTEGSALRKLKQYESKYPDFHFRLLATVNHKNLDNAQYAIRMGEGLSSSEASNVVSISKSYGVAKDAYKQKVPSNWFK